MTTEIEWMDTPAGPRYRFWHTGGDGYCGDEMTAIEAAAELVLLGALVDGSIGDYTRSRWFASGRASYAEKMLGRLCDRGLARWDGDIEDASITEAGRGYLAKLRALDCPGEEPAPGTDSARS